MNPAPFNLHEPQNCRCLTSFHTQLFALRSYQEILLCALAATICKGDPVQVGDLL